MIIRWIPLLLILTTCSGVSLAEDADAVAPAQTAQQAALTWLAMVDAERYDDSWDASAPLFQAQVEKVQWGRMAAKARQPLGAKLSREMVVAEYRGELPNAPDADYVIFNFSTEFADGKTWVETVTMMRVADRWRGLGYFIK